MRLIVRFLLVLLVMLGLGSTARAQGLSADVFGGYSLFNASAGDSRETAHGWLANVSVNVQPNISIVGDFGGHYHDELEDLFEFMGGVRVSRPFDRSTAFGQAMLGGIRGSSEGSSETNFALGFGGGIDVRARDNLSVRVIQFDWIPVRADDEWETSPIRLGFGIVFHIRP